MDIRRWFKLTVDHRPRFWMTKGKRSRTLLNRPPRPGRLLLPDRSSSGPQAPPLPSSLQNLVQLRSPTAGVFSWFIVLLSFHGPHLLLSLRWCGLHTQSSICHSAIVGLRERCTVDKITLYI